MVCRHISSGWGGGCGIQSESVVLYRSSYLSKNHNLVRFGCENKNENALARIGFAKLGREEICCTGADRAARIFSLAPYLGEAPSLRHSHSPHNDVTASPRSGRAGAERRGWFTPCAPLCHPESIHVWAALCHCQTAPVYTSPTPLPFETAVLRVISKASCDARRSVL